MERIKAERLRCAYLKNPVGIDLKTLFCLPSGSAECEEIARGAKEAYRYYFVEEHDIVSKRQAKLVRPLAFGLLDEQTRQNVAKRLRQVAEEREYTIGTGFLSTPYILPVLAENGYLEDAYRVLENTKEPGWLAMVERCAVSSSSM